MKNPCNECLVRAACSMVCWSKQNYGTLLKNATESHREYFFQKPRDQSIKSMYQYYKKIQRDHFEDVVRINTKQRDIGRAL